MKEQGRGVQDAANQCNGFQKCAEGEQQLVLWPRAAASVPMGDKAGPRSGSYALNKTRALLRDSGSRGFQVAGSHSGLVVGWQLGPESLLRFGALHFWPATQRARHWPCYGKNRSSSLDALTFPSLQFASLRCPAPAPSLLRARALFGCGVETAQLPSSVHKAFNWVSCWLLLQDQRENLLCCQLR